MRLRLLTVVGTMALALAAPSAALAHHGRGHRHHHKGHHAKFRVMNITPSGVSTPSSPGTTTPSAPEENAGTVTSFEKEVLTLTLKDNSTVSGKVTADTRIRCISPNTSSEPGNDEGPGDDNGQGDDQERGDMSESGGKDSSGHKDGGDDDSESSSAPEPPCDTSSLAPGTVVHSAQLRIGPSGNEWEFIVLVRPSS